MTIFIVSKNTRRYSHTEREVNECLTVSVMYFLWWPGEVMDSLTLEAGDDAGKVKWVDVGENLKLYASHSAFIQLVAEKRDAHWREGV